jgi:hypothetical protein
MGQARSSSQIWNLDSSTISGGAVPAPRPHRSVDTTTGCALKLPGQHPADNAMALPTTPTLNREELP